METRSTTRKKRIKIEPRNDYPTVDDIPCSQEIENIIKNKKIKVEYEND